MAAQADAAGVMAALGGASGGGGVTGVDQVLGRGSTWHKLMAHVNVNSECGGMHSQGSWNEDVGFGY